MSDGDEVVEAEVVELVPAASADELAKRVFREVEDELYGESMEVIQGVLQFAEVDFHADPNGDGPPPREWVDRWGLKKARKLYKLAVIGNMPKSEAPLAVDIAKSVAMGILKARSKDAEGLKRLNIDEVHVHMPAPAQLYAEKEVHDDDE